MPDIVDELQLKIESSVKNVDDIKKLASGLRSMAKSVEKLQGTGGTINQFVSSITTLSNLKIDKDANGIKTLTNSLVRLSKASQNLNASSLKSFVRVAKGVTNTFSNTSKGTQNAARLLNSIASVAKYSDSMQDAAANLPLIADGIKDLGEAIDKMPLSDKALQVIDSVGSMAKYSGSLASTYQKLGTSGKGVDLLNISLKALGDSLRSIGGSAVNGVKRLALAISGLGKSRNSIGGLAYNIKMLLGTVVGFRGITGIFNWTKDAVSAGAEIAEVNHIVESVFGAESLQKVDDWSHNLIENFGIAEIAGKKYAGTLSAMFQSSGVSMENAGDMSMKLVELAGDLSSFYNIDTETAYNKIKSGMVGMVRPLRDLGIDLTATTLKQYALSQGIEKSYTDMTQAEKIMLRYQYLLSVTGQQQGDFARTSQTLANSLRTLRAYAAAVTAQIGEGLGAAIRHVVHGLNYMMKYVLKAAQAFSIFMQTIFGKNVGSAGGVSLDSSMDDIADDASDLADSAGEASDGLGGAADNAEKLRKELSVLPFDELNQLNKDTEKTSSSSGKGGSGVGGIGGGIGDFGDGLFSDAIDNTKGKLGELESYVSEWGKRIRTAFDNKDWQGLGEAIASGFNTGIHALYELLDPVTAGQKINEFIDPFVTTFNSFVNAIHWDELGLTIGRGITILANAFNRLTDPETGINFENIGKSIATLMNNAIKEADWTSVGEAIVNKFMVGWRIFKGWIDEFDATEAGTALRDAIGGAIGALKPEIIGSSLGLFVTKVANFITEAFKDKKQWKDLGKKIAKGIESFFDSLKGNELADAANSIADAILTALKAALDEPKWKEKAGEDFKDFFINLKWSTIGLAAAIAFAPKLISGLFSGIKAGIIAKIAGAVEAIKTMGVGSFLVTAMTYASPAMLGKAADDLWGLIEGAIKSTGIGKTLLDWDAAIFSNFETFLHETIPQKLGELGESVVNTIKSIFSYEHTKEAWDEAVKNFKEGGTNIGQGIIKGIEAAVSFILEPIQNFFDATIQAFCEIFGIQSPATSTVFIGEDIILGILGGMQAKFEDLVLAIQGLPDMLFEAAGDAYEWLKEKGSDAIDGIRNGWDEVKDTDLLSEVSKLGSDTFESIGNIADAVKQKGSDIIDGIKNGWDEVKDSNFFNTVSNFSTDVFDAIGDIKTSVNQKGKDIIDGIRSGYDLVVNSNLFNKLAMFRGDVFDTIGDIYEKVKPKGENIIGGIKEGYDEMISDFLDIIGELPDNILTSVGDFFSLGAGLMEDFANGLESMVDFPSPHIWWDWNGDVITVGDWQFTLPTFDIDWYAKGGLFTKATLAGFGEAGDEAALPLTDKAVMSRIAGAITDNMNKDAIGISKDDIMEAVARGYVQAMMNNQGNERPIDVYATLYTEDNEVLARAVQRGNRSMDFRNNATTSFG